MHNLKPNKIAPYIFCSLLFIEFSDKLQTFSPALKFFLACSSVATE